MGDQWQWACSPRPVLEYLQAHRNGHLPARGMLSAGCEAPSTRLCTALERWGSGAFDLPRVLAPAIRYAEQGVPVGHVVAARWAPQRDVLAEYVGSERVYLRDGHPYRAPATCCGCPSWRRRCDWSRGAAARCSTAASWPSTSRDTAASTGA